MTKKNLKGNTKNAVFEDIPLLYFNPFFEKRYTSLINFLPPLKSLLVSRKKIFRGGGYCFRLLPKIKKVSLDCAGHETRSLKPFI